jgi:GMP synthase-like glutamine amidotransferase
MQIAILRAGVPPPGLLPRYGLYDDMFDRLLGPGFESIRYDVVAGEYPERPADHDAYLVTGSAAGVYEPLPWIPPLIDFLRAARGEAKLIGVCFGHQAMAQAFGGYVEKSARGWGVGLQEYHVIERPYFMADAPDRFAVPVSHQDQIVVQPPASRILAASDFSPFGMLAYDDQAAISMQFHPEFEPGYGEGLIDARRDRIAGADAAIGTYQAPNDRLLVGEWMRRFLTSR